MRSKQLSALYNNDRNSVKNHKAMLQHGACNTEEITAITCKSDKLTIFTDIASFVSKWLWSSLNKL